MRTIMTALKKFGSARIILILFLILLIAMLIIQEQPVAMTLSQSLVRVGINIVFALAMIPSVNAGIGMNFALPLGIECGLVAGLVTLEYNITGLGGIFAAMLISIPISIAAGLIYAMLINRVRGSEMMVGTYVGFSIVSLMCIFWVTAPFKNPAIMWAVGSGVRMTITLDAWYDRLLNSLWSFEIAGVVIPTGVFLVCAVFCGLIYFFNHSRTGMGLIAVGSNQNFAKINGISANRARTLGVVMSTVLSGIGIIIYAQGFGFYQLYMAPLMMAFPVIAGTLIGGATPSRISIFNAVFGTFLFQSILTFAAPIANELFPEGNLAEVFRTIISNGVILYSLTKIKGGRE